VDFEEIVPQNVETVRRRIAEAAQRVDRDPDDVQLIAVTKTFPAEAVLVAWACGVRHFGENRPRQAVGKIRWVAEELAESTPTWHMIGHIQSRKARWVVDFYDWAHAIDRQSIAEKLSRKAVAAERELPVLLECNVSGEASKYGYDVAHWETDAEVRETFFQEVTALKALPGLRLCGLMTMAPYVEDAETVRPIFASLRRLRTALQERFPEVTWSHLSMGMTNDFEVAVEEGATMVRIGRAIFGERPL
jgi:pyridoxal phosphate enzyme (YggS family)